jgi:3-oxoacyl-[acyl-carrier protein] reductase
MKVELDDKNALVCGSTQGIGKAIALQLAKSGANVTLLGRREDALRKLKEGLANNGKQRHYYILADFDDNEAVVKSVSSHLSVIGKFHILVNNSGGPAPGSALKAKSSEFLSTFKHHLINFHEISQLIIPGMKKLKFGRIINVISTSVKQPIPNLAVSNTVRAAVASWSKTLAGEVGQFGITVNNLLPGATNTNRLENIVKNKAIKLGKSLNEITKEEKETIPMQRFGEPEEFACVCTFFASDFAGYITGTNIAVDGGRTSSL